MTPRLQTTTGRPVRAVIWGFFAALFATPAMAYLDPGTGSIIIQGIIAGIAAALAAGGIFWQRIKTAFRSLLGRKDPADGDSDE